MPAGKSVTKEIECTVDKDETVALTNTVTGNHGEKAEKTIQVKKDEAVIETPVKLTDQQRKLLEQLDELLEKGGGKHSPSEKTWFDKAKDFFA